ncbi:MAG: glyoxalase superfamily protein [Pseudomonadales bacterium]|nr:glyoxalase superfamily protein [Pseudomonadales bacterium]MDG1442066.1 glyoxalase superfamily protein [Pseudomonadales bacterium]
MGFQTIPILRIFDEPKALEFYVDFLGMSFDWRHRFEDNLPLYMQVSMDDLILHLSEHSGDGTPGTKLLVHTNQLQSLFDQIKQKKYRYAKPEITEADWGARIFAVTDPFSNTMTFSEVQ